MHAAFFPAAAFNNKTRQSLPNRARTMDDALSHPLARLASLTAALGNNPDHAQLERLRSASAALLAASKSQSLGAAQHKRLWEAAAGLWVSFESPAALQHPLLP